MRTNTKIRESIGCRWAIRCLLLPLLIAAPKVAEASAGVAAYALVVGSNQPGKGQETLQFAKEDADRFGAVLKELGGYLPGRVKILYDPDAATLKNALSEITKKLDAHRAADEQSEFVFYYSGHARSAALNLGAEELPLSELRKLLEQVPATLKLVLLDACQAGAVSKVKGAAPAADFSFNSVNNLKSQGMAVIASSAADELSQESERLRGSFFTHHLTAGLRGAGDADSDGRVTLDEAYRYTYNRTLVDTAETAVGKQHVSMETDLTGEGETVLTWPSGARAQLVLDAALGGDFLVYRKNDKTVMAEVHKASGDTLRLALPPGDYEIMIKQESTAYTCALVLTDGAAKTVDLRQCKRSTLKQYNTKGTRPKERREHLFFELGIGTLVKTSDRYVTRLNDFNYSSTEVLSETVLHWHITAMVGLIRYLQVGVSLYKLDSGFFDTSSATRSFEWRAHAVGLVVRGRFPVANDWVVPYIQAGAGAAWGTTRYTVSEDADEGGSNEDQERFWRYHVSGAGGIQLMPWRFFGFFLQVEYTYAPVIRNLINDVHNSGGVEIFTGVRGGF